MKNLVLCLDGTANEFARDKTNVVKMFGLALQDEARQVSYYHPGVGTMEPPGAITPLMQSVTRGLGLAFGYGLLRDVGAAYVFLMNHYEPGDRVFLFGFSRGAYTARSLASVLRLYGLLNSGNDALVPYVMRMIKGLGLRRNESDRKADFLLAEEFRRTFRTRDCKPWFVGVWDTVSSVGWIENPLYLPFTANNPDIAHGRHAIAIDERRAFYRTNLWRPGADGEIGGPRDLKQVWFPGVHCDVGGGYPELESGLSDIALRWMVREAVDCGLLIDEQRRDALLLGTAAPTGSPPAAHESLTWKWWPCELLPKRHFDFARRKWTRRMNLGRRRTIPDGSSIHRSAYQRGDLYAAALPATAVIVD